MLEKLLANYVYAREALGRNGEPFLQYKLRTMPPDADGAIKSMAVVKDGLGKIVNDSRIIPSRAWLRKYWVDELPQLVNIARGEMSLVGIRPKPEEEWTEFPPDQKQRALRYKPGLFGIPYAHANPHTFQDLVHAQELYLTLKEIAPTLTDTLYFAVICYNILAKGMRSR